MIQNETQNALAKVDSETCSKLGFDLLKLDLIEFGKIICPQQLHKVEKKTNPCS